MLAALQIGDTSIPAEQLPVLLHKYRLVSQLAKELILDRELAPFKNTEEELFQACKRFYQQNQLNTDQELERWLRQQQMTREELSSLVDRELRLQQLKSSKWATQVESHFCQRKIQIDQVVFSMIRVKDIDMAEEIYFRIHSGESTFIELAPRYSEGIEAKTKGISGPVELGKLDPSLAGALVAARPAEVLPPIKVSNWWVIVQLESLLPAQLDEATRQRLTEELYTNWLNDQVQRYLSTSVTPSSLQFV